MFEDFFKTVFATNEFDLIYFTIAYVSCLAATFYVWQKKCDTKLKPALLNLGLFLYICLLIVFESDGVSPLVITVKVIITLLSCYFFSKILDLFFN